METNAQENLAMLSLELFPTLTNHATTLMLAPSTLAIQKQDVLTNKLIATIKMLALLILVTRSKDARILQLIVTIKMLALSIHARSLQDARILQLIVTITMLAQKTPAILKLAAFIPPFLL
jgi:hypothetical protein